MIWLIFGVLALLAIPATEIAVDWLNACRKLVAPWRDEHPYKTKARTKVWFP